MKDADNAQQSGAAEAEGTQPPEPTGGVEWIGTPEACARLGVTLRTLYRFIDAGQLPAYKMGRVIRLRAHEVEEFIQKARIAPGTLEHLYPEARPRPARARRAAGTRSSRTTSGRGRAPRPGRGEEGGQPPAGEAY
ncbi:MAG: helix-turn-helix domain-containing protein [Actinomycetota bacterium]|jgi:excisionase family DNA binding protein|nr:helix-turn-helix domain-containing protein [Actinomycetota bacterium]